MIKNYLTTEKQLQVGSHGGTGPVELYEIWKNSDFKCDIDFIDRVVVLPGSTIGFHEHGENEEMYIVLKGTGVMEIGADKIVVKRGDMILNPAGGRHGLTNNSGKDIDLLVIQVGIHDE